MVFATKKTYGYNIITNLGGNLTDSIITPCINICPQVCGKNQFFPRIWVEIIFSIGLIALSLFMKYWQIIAKLLFKRIYLHVFDLKHILPTALPPGNFLLWCQTGSTFKKINWSKQWKLLWREPIQNWVILIVLYHWNLLVLGFK